MLCALGMSNPQRAKEVYFEMSDANRQHPSTRYLTYKVALRCQDKELGTSFGRIARRRLRRSAP